MLAKLIPECKVFSPHRGRIGEHARTRDMFDQQAKERQKWKPGGAVVETLPQQTGDARDQAGKRSGA